MAKCSNTNSLILFKKLSYIYIKHFFLCLGGGVSRALFLAWKSSHYYLLCVHFKFPILKSETSQLLYMRSDINSNEGGKKNPDMKAHRLIFQVKIQPWKIEMSDMTQNSRPCGDHRPCTYRQKQTNSRRISFLPPCITTGLLYSPVFRIWILCPMLGALFFKKENTVSVLNLFLPQMA